MVKKVFVRAINGFCCSVAICTVLWGIFMVFFNLVPLVPDYAAKFESDAEAIMVQLFLVGLMSAAFSGGTVIMELPKLSLLVQSVCYFAISASVWVPVGVYCFGLGKYKSTLIGFGLSYLVTYILCWMIQYRICKREVENINNRLQQLRLENKI